MRLSVCAVHVSPSVHDALSLLLSHIPLLSEGERDLQLVSLPCRTVGDSVSLRRYVIPRESRVRDWNVSVTEGDI